MADWIYYKVGDLEYRSLTETRTCRILSIDYKDNRYNLRVVDPNGYQEAGCYVEKGATNANAQMLRVCELMYDLLNDYQAKANITFTATAKTIQVYIYNMMSSSTGWREDHVEWTDFKADDNAVNIAQNYYNTVRIQKTETSYYITSVDKSGSMGILYYAALGTVTQMGSGTPINTNNNSMTSNLKGVIETLYTNFGQVPLANFNFIITNTVETRYIKPSKKTITTWDVPASTLKDINNAISTDRGNSLNTLTSQEWLASVNHSVGTHFTTCTPNFYHDVYPVLTSNTGSWLTGTITNVIDGDTYDIRVNGSYNAKYTIAGSGPADIQNGTTYRIRLVGVDCPETKKDNDNGYAESQNVQWLADHGRPNDKAGENLAHVYQLAEDAKTFARELLLNKFVVVDLETENNGYGIGMDNHNRMLGVVHIPVAYPDHQDSINVNRTMLQTTWKTDSTYTLADLWYRLDNNGVLTSKFPVLGWTAPKQQPTADEDEELEQFIKDFQSGCFVDAHGKVWYNKSTEKDIDKIKYEDLEDANGDPFDPSLIYRSNINPLISEDDTREWDPYADMPTNYHVRIGDVTLVVPPLSIKVMQTTNNEKVNTLRNRNAIQVQSGYSDIIITMDLFFHDVDAINGYAVENPFKLASNVRNAALTSQLATMNELWPEPYYLNGLRALLAQFSKAPFVPIYNEFLETTYGIYSVGLESVQINTVPGFPNTLSVSLTMVKFDHTAYMPDTIDLGDVIDWPIFRWYVQDALQPRTVTRDGINDVGAKVTETVPDPHHIYIGKISGSFCNDVSFEMANEPVLAMRYQAIKDLATQYSPYQFKEQNTSVDTTIGKFIKEYPFIQAARDQAQNFVNWQINHPSSKYPFFYDKNGMFDGDDVNDLRDYNIFDPEIAGATPDASQWPPIEDLFTAVYGSGWEGMTTGYGSTNEVGVCFILNGNHNTTAGQTFTQWLWPTINNFAVPKNKNGGWIVIPVFSEINRNLVKGEGTLYYESSDNKYTIAIIDPTNTSLVDTLLNNAKSGGQGSIDAYSDQMDRLNLLADISEETVPMDPVQIDGLIITQISAASSNIFSKLQLQELESPTLQYLGGQEMSFTIKAQTKSRDTIRQLKNMVRDSQRLARDYRVAINSGFLNIKNDLINFLGVNSILVEQIQVQTVPGTPELIDVVLNCTAFDKTQRDRETIKQIQLRNPTSEQYNIAEFEKFFNKQRGFAHDNSSNNELEQWMIFDFKLRQQEVYPDLDLPTWDELEIALPYLNAGVGSLAELDERIVALSGNLPPDRAKYVDPDFYVHCGWTNRIFVNEVLKHGDANAMYIHDMYGVRVIENAPNKPDTQLVTPTTRVNTQFTVVDKALQEQLKADIDGVDSYLKNDPEARKFDVKSFEEYATNTTTNPYTKTTTVIKTDATPEQSSDRPHINQAELVKYIYNASSVSADTRKQMTFSNMTKLPTLDEMKKWGMVDEYGMPRADRYSNPTAASIMTEIEYMVDKLWVFPNAQDKQDSQEDFTFAGNNIISLPRITRRKVINLLKAIVDQASAFHQFFETTTNKIDGVTYSQPLPLVPVDSYGNLVYDGDKYPDIGLTQINCYSEGGARNLEEFRRVAWDWRYNLHCGIARFASCYDTNYNSANADQKTMPLDYAMTLYKGTGTQLTDSSVQNLIGIFFNRYAKAGLEYATPETPRDETAAQAENAKLTIQYKLSKDGINDPLGVKETSLTADEKSKGIRLLIWGNPPNSRCPDFYKWYQGIDDHVYLNLGISAITIADITPYCSGTQIGDGRVAGYADILDNCDLGDAVFIAIDDYLKRNSSFDPSTSVIGVTEPNPPPKPTSMDDPRYPRGFDAEVLTGSTLSEAVNTYAVSATFLPDKSTAAADAMYGSFRDSIEYDMRGRLVRAYPSFQMFIIDEGRWTFWYKLWDNLYGYNAIQSIDLIRNREIVADTLVMQMTNVYNNLSTKSSIYDDIDDSFTILNLFSGSSKDRTDAWQTIWGIANDDIIQARAEHLDTMMLKAGARIHLRLGYGSNPDNMPIVFNGTITEMDSQEIITVVAQSDGVELTSKLHNKPNDTNARFFDLDIDEPRLLICKMMSTKGSWFQDVINKTSLGQFFKNNPNSVVHFGDVTTVPPALCKLPLFQRSDDDWGEVGFNIYCANGHETFSQWICYGKIDKSNDFKNYDGLTWGKEPYTVNNGNYSQWVGEPKIKLYLYDKTIWDVVNILTDAVPDYICAVHPFELRSTLFYGKPMFGLAYKYGYLFRINQDTKQLQRIITNGFRKPYSQFHVFNGFCDIVSNKIKATETGMYTNVIVAYGGNQEKSSPLIQADSDIYPDHQKTAIVKIDLAVNNAFKLLGTGLLSSNYWTSEAYAQATGASIIANYMRHMYDGELIVLGYPSIKPHDKFYLEDNYNDMQGIAGVRQVVHHMSFETGFITCITPDCIAVNDDQQQLSLGTWLASIGGGVAGQVLARKVGKDALDRLFGGLVGRAWRRNPEELGKAIGGIVGKLVDAEKAENIKLTDDIMDALRSGKKLSGIKSALIDSQTSSKVVNGIKGFFTSIDAIADTGKAWKEVGAAAKTMRVLKMGALAVDTVVGAFGGILLTVGISILCDSLVEAYRRYRYNRQCVVVMPLKSKGRPYTAGINGHRGMIYGEPGGALDKIFEGPFFQLVDGLLFDDNKNPQLRNHLNTQNSFLTNI